MIKKSFVIKNNNLKKKLKYFKTFIISKFKNKN